MSRILFWKLAEPLFGEGLLLGENAGTFDGQCVAQAGVRFRDAAPADRDLAGSGVDEPDSGPPLREVR